MRPHAHDAHGVRSTCESVTSNYGGSRSDAVTGSTSRKYHPYSLSGTYGVGMLQSTPYCAVCLELVAPVHGPGLDLLVSLPVFVRRALKSRRVDPGACLDSSDTPYSVLSKPLHPDLQYSVSLHVIHVPPLLHCVPCHTPTGALLLTVDY